MTDTEEILTWEARWAKNTVLTYNWVNERKLPSGYWNEHRWVNDIIAYWLEIVNEA